MKKKYNGIEDQIRKALLEEASLRQPSDVSNDCLSDELICRLREGSLPHDQRQKALEHIEKCRQCRNDVAFYFELVDHGSTTSAIKLKGLGYLLPQLTKKLDAMDFLSLCKRLSSLCRTIIGSTSIESVSIPIDEILDKIETRLPSLAVRVRGKAEDKKSKSIPEEELSQIGQEINDEAERLAQLVTIQIREQENQWAGSPERWIFKHLSSAMKDRATCIRDCCEAKLELMGLRDEMRYLPSLGIGHSKRILGHAVDMMKVFENYFSDAFSYFAVYVGSYCLNLGTFLGEDAEESVKFFRSHNRHIWNFLMGDLRTGILPMWHTMGFSSEQEAMIVASICVGKQKDSKGNFVELAKAQPIFLDGVTMSISPLAISAILKLSDILDCNLNRLPPTNLLKQHSISKNLSKEYLKHELVEQVRIDEDKTIHIKIRMRYEYPASYGNVQERVRKELEEQIGKGQELLEMCGIFMPDPKFDSSESMFLEEHPYLSS